jgi:hypothetical protein
MNLPPLDLTRDKNGDCQCWLCKEARERQTKRETEKEGTVVQGSEEGEG